MNRKQLVNDFINENILESYSPKIKFLIFSSLMYLMWSYFDYILCSDKFIEFLIIRLIVVIVVFMGIALIYKESRRKYIIELSLIYVRSLHIGVAIMLPLAGNQLLSYTLALSLTLFTEAIFSKLPLKELLTSYILTLISIFASYALIPSNNLTENNTIAVIFTLASVMILGLLTRWINYSSSFNQFILRKELESTKKELEKIDQLKNNFIANITHDFRTPLMLILNNSELIIEEEDLSSHIVEKATSINSASYKLKSSVDRLLDIAKMDANGMSLSIGKIPLKEFLYKLNKFYSSALLGTSIKCTLNMPKNEISDFYSDYVKLEQV